MTSPIPAISYVFDPINNRTLFSLTSYGTGFYKSTNGGVSWSEIFGGLPTSDYGLPKAPTTVGTKVGTRDGVEIKSLAIDPTNSLILYAGASDGILYKSTNGGTSWIVINRGSAMTNINSLTIDPTNSQTIYAGTVQGVFKTLLSNSVPAITGATTATFSEGISNTFHVTASGWPAPQFNISGTLPSGVSFDTSTDTLNGTPSSGSAGTYPLIVTASNGIPPAAVKTITLIVMPVSLLAVAITSPESRAGLKTLNSIIGLGSSCQDTCPTGTQLINNTCQAITCNTGQVLIGNSCQVKTCPTGQLLVGASCQKPSCPDGQLLDNGPLLTDVYCSTIICSASGRDCHTGPLSCAIGLEFNNFNRCQAITCSTGQQLVGNSCQAISCLPSQQLVGNYCLPISCPVGQQLVNNSCNTITCTSGPGLSKVEAQVTDGTYYLQTNGTFAITPTWITVTGTTTWSLNTNTVNLSEGIIYNVYARASNGTTTSAPVSSTFTIQASTSKSATILSLTRTPDALRTGGSTTITGSLVKADATAASGQPVTLLITPPSTTATPNPSPTVLNITTDTSGNFASGVLSLFSISGVYMIQARYEGNTTLAASFTSQAIGVTPHSGYAIIISGKATDNSLLDMHNNSTDSIYSTMINKRGFLASNINYLKSTTSSAVTKQQIQDAIIIWAKAKLSAAPAPLYLIMIDHGTTSGFVLGDQTVTPDELSGWLNTLETDPAVASSGTLTNHKRFVIIGSCYSGTFISKLSKPGRVIITSAGADEQSLAGFNIYNSSSNSTFSGGEYFIDTMINFLGRGDSFKDAVTQSSTNVALRDPRKLEAGNHSGVYDTLAQHPLLDDNGDGSPSYLPASATNGTESANLTLGIGIKTLGNPADITAVTDTTFIQPTQSGDTPLWLSVNDNSRIAKAWMEVRTPITAVDSSGSSGQVIPRLIVKPLYYDGLQWNGSYTFPNAGTYKILYYTQDNQTNDIAPARNSTIYKQLASNTAPSTLTLTSPNDQGTVSGIFPLTWQPVTSTNSITYTLHVATDQTFTNEIYKEENIPQATTYIPNAKLKNSSGQYYCQNDDSYCYWKVTAIDNFGATTESNTRSFTVISTNALPSLLKGTVTDSNGPVSNATISAGSYTIKTLPNGYYLLAVPSGIYTLLASANNQSQSKSITTTAGIVTSNDFVLNSTPAQYTVTPSATTGGTISPNTPQTVANGATTTFTITPDSNYSESVSGCNGTSQVGNFPISYTTGAITANCTVTATFTPVTACATNYLPVCGTDGKTYSNSCFASVAGVAITYQGVCNAPISGTCGSANNTSVTSIPTTNLCTTGTASIVTGSGPWSWSCSGSYGGTTANCSASFKTPEVKVFMSSSTPEAFTVATSGTKLYGGTGRDVITISSGVNNVTLDQNVDRVNLPGTTGSYRFKQSGNLLKIYDENGTTLIVTIPIQGDSDGTQIGFTNGTTTLVYDAKLVLGQLTVGGYTVPPNTPAIIYPSNQRADEPAPSTTSSAAIYLSNNDVTVSNSGARVFGSGSDVLTIATGTNSITFDQNISQLKFTEMSSNYRLQQTGNMINVYAADGTTLIARGPVQANPGTRITFLNGYAYISISGGAMKLGSATINTTVPSAISTSALTQ